MNGSNAPAPVYDALPGQVVTTPPDPAAIWLQPGPRQVLDSMTQMFLAIDRNYDIVFVNRALAEVAQPRHRGFIGQNHWDLWPEMRGTIVEVSYVRAFETRLPVEFEYHYEATDVWVKVNAYPAGDYLHLYFNDITAVKQAEAEREQREQSLRELIDALPTIAWATNEDGQPVYINARWREYTGMANTMEAVRAAIHPDDLESVVAANVEARNTLQPRTYRLRLRRHDGVYRWHEVRAAPLPGQGRRFIGTTADIHNEYVAVEALRKEERRQRFLLELTEATRELTDPATILSVTVRMLCQHLGATRCAYAEVNEEEGVFTILEDWSPSAPSTKGAHRIADFGDTIPAQQRRGEITVLRNVDAELKEGDGLEAFRAISVAAVLCAPLIKEGRLIAMMALHQQTPREWTEDDVKLLEQVADRSWAAVERARAERAVKASEQRLLRILEAATVGVVVNDADGKFIYANRPLLDMLGYTPEDLESGSICWSRIQDPALASHDARALQQLRETLRCDPYETMLIRKDGSRVPIYAGAALVPDETGEGLLGAAFITDLTELKEAENKLLALNAELDQRVRSRTADLQASNEALQGFTYHVSHDLRAPLRSIIATSRLVQDEFGDHLPAEANRLLNKQAESAKKLGQLIDDLLKLSRLSREELRRRKLDFTQLAREAVEEALEAYPDAPTTIEVEEGITAEGDPRLLKLALLNLIENAIKYSPSGGAIRIGRRLDGSFFVADQGLGIAPEYHDRIFEPFQRLHREEEFSGTGIGLSNVRQVITRHGGHVWVESQLGKGATFLFTLP